MARKLHPDSSAFFGFVRRLEGEQGTIMIEIVGILLFLVIVIALLPKKDDFSAIERRHAVRQSLLRLQEKNRRIGL